MKADERKENETNSLLAWFEHSKERLKGRTFYSVIAVTVIVIAGFSIYRFWVVSRANAASALVLEFNFADTDKQLDSVIAASKNKDKNTALWAKLQKARLATYADGIARLGAMEPPKRDEAVTKVEDGRKRYEEIVNDLKDSSLQQEAYFSIAKSEECLLAKSKGSFDKVIENYRKAAAINPDSEASKSYAKEADKLRAKRDEMEKFYNRIRELSIDVPLLSPH